MSTYSFHTSNSFIYYEDLPDLSSNNISKLKEKEVVPIVFSGSLHGIAILQVKSRSFIPIDML